ESPSLFYDAVNAHETAVCKISDLIRRKFADRNQLSYNDLLTTKIPAAGAPDVRQSFITTNRFEAISDPKWRAEFEKALNDFELALYPAALARLATPIKERN